MSTSSWGWPERVSQPYNVTTGLADLLGQLAIYWCGGCFLVPSLSFPFILFDCGPVPLFVHCFLIFVDVGVPMGLLVVMAAHIPTHMYFDCHFLDSLYAHEQTRKMKISNPASRPDILSSLLVVSILSFTHHKPRLWSICQP
jgi:hypothetical protein